jgi:hypothetical protein
VTIVSGTRFSLNRPPKKKAGNVPALKVIGD